MLKQHEMRHSETINKQTPVKSIAFTSITIALCLMLWEAPIDLDEFEILIACMLVLILSYLEFGKDFFGSLGFQKDRRTFKNLLVKAPLIGGAMFALYYFILIPGITSLTGQGIDFSGFDELKGNVKYAIIGFLYIWISAAFGEEVIWRGYLMRQFYRIFGTGRFSIFLNIVGFAFLFGLFHAYQGITGQIITAIIGMLLAIIYQIRKFDLWFNIAVHGYFDTIALIVIYKGWL